MGHVFALFGEKVFEIALPSLATIIAGLLVGLLTRKLQSAGITLDQQQQDRLKTLTADTIKAIEEQSNRTAMSSTAKDALAVARVSAAAPRLDPSKVRQLVDATLPEVRAQLAPAVVVQPPITYAPMTPAELAASK